MRKITFDLYPEIDEGNIKLEIFPTNKLDSQQQKNSKYASSFNFCKCNVIPDAAIQAKAKHLRVESK